MNGQSGSVIQSLESLILLIYENISTQGAVSNVLAVEEKAIAIQRIFNGHFTIREKTRLVAGAGEPIYVPEGHRDSFSGSSEIHFAHGYTTSALHEISHWCIAGKKRRMLVDYGYWYVPDGRNEQQQAEFEKVEVKPQALEWILSEAAQVRFNVSLDNLHGNGGLNAQAFKQSVASQARLYLQVGLPDRAEKLRIKFIQAFRQGKAIDLRLFDEQRL